MCTIALFKHKPNLIVTRVNDLKEIEPGFFRSVNGTSSVSKIISFFVYIVLKKNKLLNDSKVLVYFCQTNSSNCKTLTHDCG